MGIYGASIIIKKFGASGVEFNEPGTVFDKNRDIIMGKIPADILAILFGGRRFDLDGD